MSTRALIYCILLFIVALVGFIRYRQLSTPFKILSWSVAVIFLTMLADRYYISKHGTNAPVMQIQCLEEYVFYSMVYYFLFKSELVKKFILISIAILVLFFPINAVFFQPFFNTFPTNINTPSLALYAIFSLILFKEMLDYPVKMNIVTQSIFWFNTAMLFYSTTSFFLLGLTNYFSATNFKDNLLIFYLWWGIEYLFHIFICIGFLTYKREQLAVVT